MATFFYRQKHSRRRLAALNFLSNISLDGSLHDNNKCEPSCRVNLLNESSPKDSKDYNKECVQTQKESLRDVNEILGLKENGCDEENNETSCTNHIQPNTYKDEGRIKTDQEMFKKVTSTSSVRERSATMDTMSKGQKPFIHPTFNIYHPLAITGGTIPTHSEKVPAEYFESSSGYLFPNSSHCRRISSNTSESSYSPTGSGAKEKEVRFLTSAYDWSSQMTDQRLVLVTCHCSPVVLFSTLPFSRISKLSRGDFRSESGRRRHASSGARPVSSTDYPDLYQLLGMTKPGEGQVVSYSQMLVPTASHVNRDHVISRRLQFAVGDHGEADFISNKASTSCYRYTPQDPISFVYRSNHARPASPLQTVTESMKNDYEEDSILSPYLSYGHCNYHPSLLDDPELIVGKHSTRIALLTFSSYMTSVIDYVKPSDLKKELNDKFREKFPHIHLTLSKIRSLKREMRKVAKQDSGTDLLTVAQSYVYFEKLILRGLVHKGNRKLCAGASLLLSAKMNDVKGDTLKTLIEEIQNNFRISRRELFASEFAVLVALEFSLHSPIREIFSHYQRLLYDS